MTSRYDHNNGCFLYLYCVQRACVQRACVQRACVQRACVQRACAQRACVQRACVQRACVQRDCRLKLNLCHMKNVPRGYGASCVCRR